MEGVRLIEVVKIVQCLLTINVQQLLCTVKKLHFVKEAIQVQVYYPSLLTLVCLLIQKRQLNSVLVSRK